MAGVGRRVQPFRASKKLNPVPIFADSGATPFVSVFYKGFFARCTDFAQRLIARKAL